MDLSFEVNNEKSINKFWEEVAYLEDSENFPISFKIDFLQSKMFI